MQFINFEFKFVVMLRSDLCGMKKYTLLAAIISTACFSYCFKSGIVEQDWLLWANKCLMQSYDATADSKLKKFEFSVTGDSFIRLRKTYEKGKEEYYSFNLHQLNDVEYSGNTAVGILQLKAKADDIIVQTRNDRKGDVDSMTTVLNVPVRNMAPERLDSLKEALNYLKAKEL
jgi:hypothetical protein